MNYNIIVNNSPTSIDSSGDSFNAQYNWWGSNNPDFASLIKGRVNYNPWSYMSFIANPNSIITSGTANLTTSFNNAFDGTTITPLNPVDGHLPDGTLVNFSTDLGSLPSGNKETINGIATNILMAGSTSGIAHITAKINSQTINNIVTILPIIDKTAPKVTYTYPKKFKTKQSRTATLYIKFSEKIKACTYWSKIYVKDLKTGEKSINH